LTRLFLNLYTAHSDVGGTPDKNSELSFFVAGITWAVSGRSESRLLSGTTRSILIFFSLHGTSRENHNNRIRPRL
jgi:hypothetical protein